MLPHTIVATYFVFCLACSTHTSTQCFALNSLIKVGSHSSLAMPRSLQHRIRALDLQASVAVGMPDSSKYSCSPRATETSLLVSHIHPHQYQNYVPSQADQSPFPTDDPLVNMRLSSWCKSPPSRSKCSIQCTTILDLGKI